MGTIIFFCLKFTISILKLGYTLNIVPSSGCFLNRALNVVTLSIICIFLKHETIFFLSYEIYDLKFELSIYTKTLVPFSHLFSYKILLF